MYMQMCCIHILCVHVSVYVPVYRHVSAYVHVCECIHLCTCGPGQCLNQLGGLLTGWAPAFLLVWSQANLWPGDCCTAHPALGPALGPHTGCCGLCVLGPCGLIHRFPWQGSQSSHGSPAPPLSTTPRQGLQIQSTQSQIHRRAARTPATLCTHWMGTVGSDAPARTAHLSI